MIVMTRLILSISLMFSLVACGGETANEKEEKKFKTYTVTAKSLVTKLHYSDYIRPIRTVSVVSPADGRVFETNINFGDNVEKGKILLKVSSDKLAEEYYAAVSEYLKAKDQFELNQVKFLGTTDLWKEGLTSRNTYIQEKSAVDTGRVAVFQAVKKLETIIKKTKGLSVEEIKKLDISDEKAVRQALERQFNLLEAEAETSGVLLEPPKSSGGDATSDGKTALSVGSEVKKGQLVALIGDLTGISLNIKVAEIDLDKIKPGIEARISSVAFPNTILKGTVRQVNFQASATGGSVGGLPTFPGIVEVPKLTAEEKKLIRVGMSATVELKVEKPNVLMIPIDAVYQEKGQSFVKRIEGDKVVAVPVTTGETSYNDVVINSGLKAGDKIQYQEKAQVIIKH